MDKCLKKSEQKPIAWMYDFLDRGDVIQNWVTQEFSDIDRAEGFNVRPLYTASPQTLTIEAAVAAEREACAQIVERNAAVCIHSLTLWDVLNANALAIRARSNTNEQ